MRLRSRSLRLTDSRRTPMVATVLRSSPSLQHYCCCRLQPCLLLDFPTVAATWVGREGQVASIASLRQLWQQWRIHSDIIQEHRLLVGVASRRLQQQVKAVLVSRAVRARPRALSSHTHAPPITTVSTRHNVKDADVLPRGTRAFCDRIVSHCR